MEKKMGGEGRVLFSPYLFVIGLLLIVVIILGVFILNKPLEFYPPGRMGDMVPYYTKLDMIKCDICGEETTLFKLDSKDKVWCNKCYRTKILNK